MIVLVKVLSFAQIDRFKNYLYLIGLEQNEIISNVLFNAGIILAVVVSIYIFVQ